MVKNNLTRFSQKLDKTMINLEERINKIILSYNKK